MKTMSKIVFFCIPAHGHTNPTLGVVKELCKRGHQVWYYSYNQFREKIEKTGAVFVSCDNFDMELKLKAEDAAKLGSDIALSMKVLVDTTLALDETVCRHMEELQPDCIVADSMAVWGKAIAQKLNIPFVSSTTTFAFNQHSSKIMKQDWKQALRFILSIPKANREVKRLQAKGYPFKDFLSVIQNDENTDTIVYTSREFQPYSETFSEKYAFVGPSIRESNTEWNKTREKLIYISMGTVNNDKLPFYHNCIEALKDSPYEVVISVGNLVDLQQFGTLPENISVFPSVDQIAVLKKADVFLSHCGMNSVSESLYYGVPLVLYPQTTEQNGVANRTAQCNAGIFLKETSPATIRETIETVLHTEDYYKNAAVIADGFRRSGGAAAAADKILSLI